MKIGELAGAAGVSTKTIRYYESIGVLPAPPRTGSGYRDYDDTFIDRLAFIRTAQRLGVTLDEVKEIRAVQEQGTAPCTYVRTVLDTQLTLIGQRIRELELLRGQLREIVAEADRLPTAAGNFPCGIIEHARQKAASAAG